MYMLDTNICIYIRKEAPPQVLAKLMRQIIPVLDFDSRAAEAYGDIRANLEKQGLPIGSNDFLIAAHALSAGMTLVTNNTNEFNRVPNLKVENWV